MMRRAIALVALASLLAACAARRETIARADRRALAFGLGDADRRAFTSQVEECVRRADEPPQAPSGTLGVGASGEAAGNSAAGLAGIGVMASAIAAGVVYRLWRGAKSRDVRPAGPKAIAPAASATSEERPVSADPSGCPPSATADPSPDQPADHVDACIERVAARWRATGVPASAPAR